MPRAYTSGSLAPIWIVAVLGAVSLAYFLAVVGPGLVFRPYLWPSLILTPFFLYCAFRRQFALWHLWFWRIGQLWSGFWVISFILLLPSVMGLLLFLPVVEWCEQLNINPWLALGIHLLFFGCCTDVLRHERTATQQKIQSPPG